MQISLSIRLLHLYSSSPITRAISSNPGGGGDGDQFTKCPQVDPVNCANALHNYGDKKGSYDVCLVVLSPEGCYDTACATVFNYFEVFINIPNGFSPDGDGVNDDFKVEAKNLTSYKKKIFTRFRKRCLKVAVRINRGMVSLTILALICQLEFTMF